MEPYQFRTEAGLPMTSTATAELMRRRTCVRRPAIVVALAVVSSPALLRVVFGNRIVFFGLIIAQLGLVFFLSGRASSLAPSTAALLFVAYSALTYTLHLPANSRRETAFMAMFDAVQAPPQAA